jgi:hypothetical protein
VLRLCAIDRNYAPAFMWVASDGEGMLAAIEALSSELGPITVFESPLDGADELDQLVVRDRSVGAR